VVGRLIVIVLEAYEAAKADKEAAKTQMDEAAETETNEAAKINVVVTDTAEQP
jgi:hypothetical protein